jgi:hypothetical protein
MKTVYFFFLLLCGPAEASIFSDLLSGLPELCAKDAERLLDTEAGPRRFRLLNDEPLRDLWGNIIRIGSCYSILMEAERFAKAFGSFVAAVEKEQSLHRSVFFQITVEKQRVGKVAACLLTFYLGDQMWSTDMGRLVCNAFGKVHVASFRDRALCIIGEELANRDCLTAIDEARGPLAALRSQRPGLLF